MSYDINDLEIVGIPLYKKESGVLGAISSEDLGHEVVRIFFVKTPKNAKRGAHGHFRCWQTLLCVKGSIQLKAVDEFGYEKTLLLTDSDSYLTIPPTIWAEQISNMDENILLVLASEAYDPSDYFYKRPKVRLVSS